MGEHPTGGAEGRGCDREGGVVGGASYRGF